MGDRETLIELVTNARGNALWHNAPNPSEYVADMLIASGVTVQKWIPVSERLPEDDLTEKERMERKQIRCILSNGKRVFAGSRQRYDTNQKWHWNRYRPTFWMYFPELPKGECNDKNTDFRGR